MSGRWNIPRWWFVPVLAVFALVAAACAGSASAGGSSGSGPLSMHITSPSNGATVPSSFVVKVDASVPLGDPSTGNDHVHLCFDGASCDTEYKLVYGGTFTVSSLSPGTHTIEASLRNADHSAAGPTATITVHVGSGTTSSTGSTSTSTGSTGSGAGASSGTGSSNQTGSGGYGNGGGYGGGY
jgi:hypothetical protein